MGVGREIRTKINSVKSTQKITRAMEMVAASKMRRAQERMQQSRPYAENIRHVIGHLASSQVNPHDHPLLATRPIKRVGLLVVSSDRGLAGGLNSNLFRVVVSQLRTWKETGVSVECAVLGSRGEQFFRRLKMPLLASAVHLGDAPTADALLGVVKVLFDAYEEASLDAIFIASNRFVNTMVQKSELQQMLPLPPSEEPSSQHKWDYLYEPSPEELLRMLLERYVQSQVYQSVIENLACEQAARMVAMKSASDNAGQLIEELQLVYNKARQAAITKELAEIVAGAEAV